METDTKSPVHPPALTRYFIEGLAGRLQFPVYETNVKGDVIVVPGETVCRVPGCSNSTKHPVEWHNLVGEASIIAQSTKEDKRARIK
ncbi:uncharacterized protein N7503_005096 [Penicillium pulvis]|uniref:uncharacterized protein n=1 Tax=Penicillium pulvis TaxID=1562058 RepID=UPI00254919CE|nr:uncharacterized protein N7503_005096 [Penicillium pulvis]KAJ5802646.1 hypothetical protein N7503_005096 [Penicillium pulvis]